MASKKAASKSCVASDAYTGPITRSRSKGITQEQDQGSDIAQSILKQLMEFPKAAMVEMERKVNFLMKVVEERDNEITALIEQMRTRETSESIQQLQDMIANSIRAQYGGSPQTSFMYSKPYTLRMPLGYQPPKFQQFDGKGNPKQHIAYFVETCENAGSKGDQLARQFVRSLN
ncbi:ty3-gypsy retrotransposon protein [Cucumis melo var. makuwa]|uniref:Ty3-gypsy retrotransposon protein n=1 Tax=Cucumis melo var. makuwa TaxID=1194695 RepID=A0A5A7TZV2_CUCMM|nr:ty3-gypsy retrotransposon protein [Cucumis melo var. makuwa]